MSRQLIEPLKLAMMDNWQRLQKVSLHDWYCYAFARSNGFKWFIDPVPTMQYRQHESNQVGANIGWGPLIARYKTIYDGWWFSQVQLIASLIGRGEDPFVRSWQRLNFGSLLRLSFSAFSCRRRSRDKVFFFMVCWATALIGSKS
jgi:rhamnosyltransferase